MLIEITDIYKTRVVYALPKSLAFQLRKSISLIMWGATESRTESRTIFLSGEVKHDGEFLYVNGAKIHVFGERDPANINWASGQLFYYQQIYLLSTT